MKQAGKQQNQIAAVFGISPSTISRELAHNTGLRLAFPERGINSKRPF